jgi:predicted transcriptional regulator
MPRSKSETLTRREAEIMEILWQRRRATAEEVRAAMSGDPHDSTVRTLLRVLESKGHVRRDASGNAHVYYPTVGRENAQRKAVKTLLDRLFGGSAESLVARLIEDEQLSAEQLNGLRKATPKRRKKGGGKGGHR